jgi:hypothetical protein
MSEDQNVKCKLQLGRSVLEYEGSESFLRSEIPKLLDKMGGLKATVAATERLTLQDLDNQIDEIKGDLDFLSEMGENESLRLQMAMDRLSKLMSTLSSLLKKISDISSAIVQNMK